MDNKWLLQQTTAELCSFLKTEITNIFSRCSVRAISLCHIKNPKAQRGKGMWKTAVEEKDDSMLCIILFLLVLFCFCYFL